MLQERSVRATHFILGGGTLHAWLRFTKLYVYFTGIQIIGLSFIYFLLYFISVNNRIYLILSYNNRISLERILFILNKEVWTGLVAYFIVHLHFYKLWFLVVQVDSILFIFDRHCIVGLTTQSLSWNSTSQACQSVQTSLTSHSFLSRSTSFSLRIFQEVIDLFKNIIKNKQF